VIDPGKQWLGKRRITPREKWKKHFHESMVLLRLAVRHPLRTLFCVPYLMVFLLGWISLAMGAVIEEVGFYLDHLSRRFSDWIIEHVP